MAGRAGYILILSHMRSYSTLLAHLLGSHPEIGGYAECSTAYRSRLGLFGLRCRLVFSQGFGRRRYALDKVLHDGYAISERVLRQPGVVPIILLRKPEPTIASIFTLGALAGAQPWYTDPEAVTRYYVRRLSRLKDYAGWTRDRAIVVRSEQLVHDPQPVLTRIAGELELNSPLSTKYQLFEHTGKPGYGDPSARILAGRVIAPKEDRDLPSAISEAQCRRARLAYAACIARLPPGLHYWATAPP